MSISSPRTEQWDWAGKEEAEQGHFSRALNEKSLSSCGGSGSPWKGQAHPIVICSAFWGGRSGTSTVGMHVGSLGETQVLAGACDAELMADRGRNTVGQGKVGGGWPSLGATCAWGQDRSQLSDVGEVRVLSLRTL